MVATRVRTWRRQAWGLGVGTLMVLLCGACARDDVAGQDDSAQNSTSSTSAVTTPTTPTTPTTSASGAAAGVQSGGDDGAGIEAGQEPVTLVLEAWNTDVRALWDTLLADFERANPEIDVVYQPTNAPEYDQALRDRFGAGVGGDIITCRPFDVSLGLFQDGYLADLSDTPAMDVFSDEARQAWTTDDGESSFCVPVSSVVHGFLYNKDAFAEVGVTPPETIDELLSVLQTFADDGRYVPISVGAADAWRPGNHVFQTLGPTFWGGEQGRQELLAGDITLDDDRFVDLLTVIGQLGTFLPDGASSMATDDALRLFEFGDAAIYSAGSWEMDELSDFEFEIGAFPPPPIKAGDTCQIIDHPDLGLGLNPASPNFEQALIFLDWVASPAFVSAYVSQLSGQFSMSPYPVDVSDGPSANVGLSAEFDSWRQRCGTTSRLTTQILERGPSSMERLVWDESQALMLGEQEPAEAAKALQEQLESWYVPGAD